MLGGKVADREWAEGAGAHAAGGKARPLHHQHGLRQLRHRRGGIGRSAHQGHLHGHPGRRPTPAPSTAARPPASWSTSSPPRATRSSACNVPASRIIGGYSVKDGVIVPRYSHGEVIEAVFRRTRVTVAIMTSAKLLSRGGAGDPLSARALPRRLDRRSRLAALRTRAANEAGRGAPAGGRVGHRRGQRRARLRGRARVRPARSAGEAEGRNHGGARHHRRHAADAGACAQVQKDAIEYPARQASGAGTTTCWCSTRMLDSVANVLCPACKLWNTGHGAQHDARSRQPDGRLRHHRGLPRIPGPQVDGLAARSHLRRSRSRAAPPAQRHHDGRAVPGAVPRSGSARCG